MDLAVAAIAFGTIFLVELPDKTFLATLVLSTRYRPLLVWIGVGLAFAVQTTIAVLLGHAASFLPEEVVQVAAAVMFLIGAVLLLREARAHQRDRDADEGAEFAERAKPATGWRAVLASFLVLLAAEWGDLSQLLTISLVARYEAPFEVFVGALGALLAVSGLAVLVGRTLMRWVPMHVLFYAGAGVCLVLEAFLIWELVR
ncbi:MULTISPECIES: TMEM165/GDT1 family protein [unclassified Nocardioides]|uniref:TMEM165/GDT1 family protein n=1 Tax=unclassified Nocardioides TaxID=2615069 RepID=UPI002666B0A9|nr:TMEM165/GDT1 family protein [Nocardioides sp. Arc9.136]WKN48643.1 TMEM165/GDT1 family protein [Nocardioides sp. Arc9.136]